TPFGKLLATPPDGRPVTQYPDRDQALLEVAKAVRAAAQRIPTSKAGPPAPTSGPAAASPTLSEPHRASRGEAEPNSEARPTVPKRSMRWFLSTPTVVFSRNEASAPHIEIDAITQINEELIAQHHIEGLIIDIDQTVVPQSKADISDYIVAHIKHL